MTRTIPPVGDPTSARPMYGIQFQYQRGSERSNLALAGCTVHSLIPIVDSDLKVAHICPLSNRNGMHNVDNFIRAGGK